MAKFSHGGVMLSVAVCSGLHREPNLPVIPGLHHVPEAIHSSNFKTKSQFGTNKTVMVIGSGETGADIAYLAVNSPTKQVLMCHNDGFHFAPKRNPGPVLLPILGRKPDPNEPGIPIDSLLWICSGLPYRPKQPGPNLWLYSLRSAIVQTPVPDTHGKQVDLAPLPKKINKDGIVEFYDNGKPEYGRLKCQAIRPDMIVLCTGYKQTFTFLRESLQGDKKHPLSLHEAIPPLAEMQAQLWVLNLVSPHKVAQLKAAHERHYKLHTKLTNRVTYGVDHESYVYQLALDMNSTPGFVDILQRESLTNLATKFHLLVIWALGAHFNTKFRLIGPWA
ncbi:unnamed protein product [Fusarium venenatum]|uniref:L-ornithine N(5)-oxygenase n=1 Tax=Fusarium venenatum TaxID=56646 RepID=A0A2L2T737_9HYPO|nr:uncharacterized protein FVRRES_12499 [Fusarium venenatum]KAH6979111.1 hypothetical protein EDB82DRAFT_477831 [Fusarium venenatum]CEI39808.1 unnamed protein product [Fusarium venenatum]